MSGVTNFEVYFRRGLPRITADYRGMARIGADDPRLHELEFVLHFFDGFAGDALSGFGFLLM